MTKTSTTGRLAEFRQLVAELLCNESTAAQEKKAQLQQPRAEPGWLDLQIPASP